MERTTSGTALPGPIIDIIDLDNYSYRTPERLQGSFLTVEKLSDSGGGVDVHVVYEIESDKDEEVETKRRRRRRRLVVDTESEESDYSSPKRRMITDNTQKRHYLRNKSVKVVPSEVWLKIFSFSHPAFLARARRISKNFRTLIDDEKVWRYARLYHFPDYPSPAFDLKESEMWNLYLGTGCMICSAPKIKNRYWRFRIRCCVDCLGKATIKEDDLKFRHGFKPRWMKYLFPSVLRYGKWKNWSAGFGLRTYCLEDVKFLERGMRPQVPHEGVLMARLERVRKDIEIMEIFEEKPPGQRYLEIRKRLSLLNLPFGDGILSHIPAYESAIKIQRPLTDRSWNILLKKLEAGRGAAMKKIADSEWARHQERLKSGLYKPKGAAAFSNLKELLAPPPGGMGERMTKVFFETQLFPMLPDSHRLFLWFRLCIAMHWRDYAQVPDIRPFALAADTIHEPNGKPAFEGFLVCGICSSHQSKKKKPWLWANLSQHFGSHCGFRGPWPQKLLELPTTADISESCSRIEDKTVRRRWIELIKEADKELGGVLGDKLRLEEDAARSKVIQVEKSRKVVNGEKDQANYPQSQKRRREADLLQNPGRRVESGGDNRDKRLKVGSGGYKNVPVPSFSNIPSWETSRDPIPQVRARETSARETTAKYVEALPRKPVEVPPVIPRVQAPGTTAKPAAALPMKPGTMPPERAQEPRPAGITVKPVKILPRKPVEMPPAILSRGQETRVPRTVAGVLPTKPPETSLTRARGTRAPAESVKILPRDRVEKPPAMLPRDQGTRVVKTAAKSIKILPDNPVEKPPAILARDQTSAKSVKILPDNPVEKPLAIPPRDQETRAVKTATKPAGTPPVKPPTMPPASTRETRVLETAAKSVKILPENRVEKPPAILPGDQTSAKSVKILPDNPAEKPLAIPPRDQETRAVKTATKPAGTPPVKPPTMPPASTRETRVLETAAKSVKILSENPVEKPPAILPSAGEPLTRANPKLPEDRKISRDRSPSVDMDIEALFADA